jgi:CD2 antigen cytoplasmic tail-binding protein 2
MLLLLLKMFTSDGIPIEPFHLRRERAEGFFDAEGNYVEYRLEPESDAWLDSLGVSCWLPTVCLCV